MYEISFLLFFYMCALFYGSTGGHNFWPRLQIQLEVKPESNHVVDAHVIIGLFLCFKIVLCGLEGTLGHR